MLAQLTNMLNIRLTLPLWAFKHVNIEYIWQIEGKINTSCKAQQLKDQCVEFSGIQACGCNQETPV